MWTPHACKPKQFRGVAFTHRQRKAVWPASESNACIILQRSCYRVLSWILLLSSLRMKGDEQQTSHTWIQLCTSLWPVFDMVLFCLQQLHTPPRAFQKRSVMSAWHYWPAQIVFIYVIFSSFLFLLQPWVNRLGSEMVSLLICVKCVYCCYRQLCFAVYPDE